MSRSASPVVPASRLGRLVGRLGLVGTVLACLLAATAAVALLGMGAAGPSQALSQASAPLWLAGLMVAACVPGLAWLLWRVSRLETANGRLLALLDDTGLDGPVARHRFTQDAGREWARARRYGEDAALLLIEADHFKALAAEHGNLAGEAIVRDIARVAGACLREPDLLARHAVETLVVMLPHTDPLGALDVAERIRERVAANRMPYKGVELATTVSVGVASLGAGHAGLDALRRDAEQALLAARLAGRNCVRAAPIQPRTRGEDRSVKSR